MARRGAERSLCLPDSSRKSRGDYYSDDCKHVVDERRQRQDNPRQLRDDCYAEPLRTRKNIGQYSVSSKPKLENKAARNRYDRMPMTEAPYLYQVEVEADHKLPQATEAAERKNGKNDMDTRDPSIIAGASVSSYYGDTSVEAMSVIGKNTSPPLKRSGANKNGEQGACKGDVAYKEADEINRSDLSHKAKNVTGAIVKNGGRRNGNAPGAYSATDRGFNGRRHSASEPDVLATGAIPLQGEMVPRRGNHHRDKVVDPGRPLVRPFEDKTPGGPFGDKPDLEGLMPADAGIASLEKDRRIHYITTKARALPASEDIIQVSSESSMVGVPAPEPRKKLSNKVTNSVGLNGLERSNRPLLMAERKDFNLAADDSSVQRRAAEQEPSKRNGQKGLPVVEEPVVVPAVAEMSDAIKAYPQRKNGCERTVVKSQAAMTGERYPLGKDSYYGRDTGPISRNGRYGRHFNDSSVLTYAEGREDTGVINDNRNGLQDEIKRNTGGRRNGGTNERKSDSTSGKASQLQSGAGSGRTQRRFVFKRQQVDHSGVSDVDEDYDDVLDPSYRACAAGSGTYTQRRDESSGNYVSARGEPEECCTQEQAWNRKHHHDRGHADEHWESDYSDAGSDVTIKTKMRWEEIGSDEERFRTANSRWSEENEGWAKCHRAHQMGYGGGRFIQESAEVRRKFVSGARFHDDEVAEGSLGDESPSLEKESQSWSIVSSDGNAKVVDRRRWVTSSDHDEGTTSFSVGSSCWLTPRPPTRPSRSSGGQPASSRLDTPLMGDFRSRSNIVLRRSNSALHECLENLRSSPELQASGPVLVLLGGINPQDPMREDLGSAVIRYLFEEDTWELCGFMPHARSYHTAAYVEDHIYIVGGFNLDALEYEGPAASAACFSLDVLRMSWKKCASMSQARACHACVAVGTCIYVAGGKDNSGRITDTVECFDVTNGRWESLPSLPRPLMASAAVYFGCHIWILGGVTTSAANRSRITDAVYEFDLQHGRWFQAVSLWAPFAYSLALTTTDSADEEHLWLWGGMDEDGHSMGELRSWRPKRRIWKRRCRLQPARHAFCGAVVGNQMCLLGGIESQFHAATDAHTQVDPTQKALCSGCPIPYPVTGACAVALSAREKSTFVRIAPSDEDTTDGQTLKMRTVYRRYRQRRKVKDVDELADSQFPAVGVFESTRILDSTFDSARIRRQDISREKSPDHGTKEERLELELRNSARERRKELEKKRETKCSDAAGRRSSYQILAPAIDPNCGLALHIEGEKEAYSTRCSDTAMAIQSIRPCRNVSSVSTWAVLSFGGIDLHRPACHEIGRLALCFRPLKNGWELLDAMPAPRNYHTASLIGDEVFVVGGCDPGRTRCDEMVASDSVFCFSTSQRSWTERAKMLEARAFHGATVLGDRLYVIGGRDQNGRYLDTVAVYSPMLDSWSVLLNMPLSLMGAAVVAYHGRIWVLGGVGLDKNDSSTQNPRERTLDDVFVIDTHSARCRTGPSLPYPCAFAAAAVCDDQIWLCGGMTPDVNGKLRSTSNIYVLDDGAVWVFYDLLALNRHAFPAVSYADAFVLLFGGVTTDYEGSVDECEVFYVGPGHGTLRLRSPPFTLAGHACVVLDPSGDSVPDVRDIWRHLCEATERS